MAGPTPRVAAARSALLALGLPPGTHLVVACSGGPDSLALAATLAHLAPRHGWEARAVVVDHSLREGSAADAAAAAAACRELGLPAEVRTVAVAGDGTGAGAGGPEAAARTVRYAALEAAATAFHPDALVLLGHTMDDQAETVLLRLARGSGARSLAGMPAATGRFRRPFLGLRRADTLGICADLALPYRDDPSNAADGGWVRSDGGPLLRSAVRHGALPALVEALGPGVVEALARTAGLLRRDADLLEALAEDALGRAVRHWSTEHAELDVVALAAEHPALRTRVLYRVLVETSGCGGAYAARHVDAVDRLVTDYHGQGAADLPGRVTARRSGDALVIERRG
ncbi:MAG: tRNA lysidine(34) synthetase TilS [Actinobacteria bacterium]|nr:tRNA lysidine(34) synthetase TilS [Actinomycetota bacterium]